MENTVQAVSNKLSAWQASGGALTGPMSAPIGRPDQHLASGAHTAGPPCPSWVEMSAAGFTWNPNAPQCIEAESSDSALSAAALTMNSNAPMCIKAESSDPALSAAAATSAAFGCPVF